MRASIPDTASRRPRRSPDRRLGGVTVVTLLLCATLPVLHAGDETPRERLVEAQDLETIHRDTEGALAIFEEVARLEAAPPDIRRDAWMGAARCHEAAGRLDRAEEYWNKIIGDEELGEQAQAWARKKKAEKAEAEIKSGNGGSTDVAIEEGLQRILMQRRRLARERVEAARAALEAGRYGTARSLCLEALGIDHENQQASALLQQIESRQPDRGDLLRRLIEFLQTAQLEEYERLRAKVANLRVAGEQAFNKKDYARADRILREAIGLIDQSDFLSAGGALRPDSLETERTRLLLWLRETHERGREQGLTFVPEPPLPDLDARSGGLQKEFYGLMARVFSPHEAGEEPLRFYEFAPVQAPDTAPPALGPSDFFESIDVGLRPGSLTRARWAERWIRRNVGAGWSDPARTSAAAVGSARILTRFGGLICAQHREAEHGRIRKLRDAFADVPPALRVDVHVFAADSGGAVRAAAALRARAGPRDSGLDVIVHGRLIEECVRDLARLKGLVQLGSAQVLLEGGSTVTLDVTRLTAEHPAYAELEPPPLSVPDVDARYGLWLELYAEDMPNRAQPGNDRCALSVRARVRHPAEPVSSHVVPRSMGKDMPYTRLPLLTGQVWEADRELPHFATFLMLGLGNPFPQTRAKHGELLVLVGVRRQDTPTPDPPRTQPNPRIIPEDALTKDYPLGSLAYEVLDEAVRDGWPDRRSAAEGMTATDRHRRRSDYLAALLGEMANLGPAVPGAPPPIVVGGQHATATVSTEEHVRLQQAVLRLRSHQNACYAVQVQAAVVPAASWAGWSAADGVERNDRGNVLAAGAARAALEQHLALLVDEPGLFSTRRTLLTRATQQVAQVNVRPHPITKDLRVRLLGPERQRYTRIPGTAEEGLIVEVRPGIEQGEVGLRSVYARVRVARLQRIESRPYPRATLDAARYDVPVWYAGTDGAFSQRFDAEILDDDKALFLPVPMPGAEDKLIVVEVRVLKVQ